MNRHSGAPVLSKRRLEAIAGAYTDAFVRFDGKDSPKFSVWKFAACYLGKKVRLEWLSGDGSILGLSVFIDHTPFPIYDPDTRKLYAAELGKDTILLDNALVKAPLGPLGRARFTLMHECAHQILHKDYYTRLAHDGSGRVAYSLQTSKDEANAGAAPRDAWTDDD